MLNSQNMKLLKCRGFTGPFTVGPIIAAPACIGWPVKNVLSISLIDTPGEDCKVVPFYFFIININFFSTNVLLLWKCCSCR
jgi:hypothetical protein